LDVWDRTIDAWAWAKWAVPFTRNTELIAHVRKQASARRPMSIRAAGASLWNYHGNAWAANCEGQVFARQLCRIVYGSNCWFMYGWFGQSCSEIANMKKYLVTAAHVSPRWCFKDHLAIARPAPGRDGFWCATSDQLGCSRDHHRPEDAVRSLFYANACHGVRLVEVQS
jgi:hypothetical protein